MEIGVKTITDDRGVPYKLTENANFTTLSNVANILVPVDKENRVMYCSAESESGCEPYLVVEFFSSLSTVDYLRVYKPITDMLGTIGGVKEIIFLVFSYLNLLFTSGAQKKRIVEKVFGIAPQTTRCLCFKKAKGRVGERNGRGAYLAPAAVCEQAYAAVLGCLDVCNMSRDFFALRFLSAALLRDYQAALLPFVALNAKDPPTSTPKPEASTSDPKSRSNLKDQEADQVSKHTHTSENLPTMKGNLKDGIKIEFSEKQNFPISMEKQDIHEQLKNPNLSNADLDRDLGKAWIRLTQELIDQHVVNDEKDHVKKPNDFDLRGESQHSFGTVHESLGLLFSQKCSELLGGGAFMIEDLVGKRASEVSSGGLLERDALPNAQTGHKDMAEGRARVSDSDIILTFRSNAGLHTPRAKRQPGSPTDRQ